MITMTRTTWGGQGSFSSQLLATVHYPGRHGIPQTGRNLVAGTGAEIMGEGVLSPGLHLRASPASFLIPARVTHTEVALIPVGWTHTYQSSILILHSKNWGSGKWQPPVPEAETSRLAIGLIDCGSRMWGLSPQLCYFVSGSPWMLHLISWFHLQNGVQTCHGDIMSDYGWRVYIWA